MLLTSRQYVNQGRNFGSHYWQLSHDDDVEYVMTATDHSTL